MKSSIDIRVRYPHAPARDLVLLTEADWSSEVPPTHVDPENHCSTFTVSTDRTFLYFKPGLKVDGQLHFCRGANYLALGSADEYDIYPHFFEASVGSVTDLEHYACSHDPSLSCPVRVYLPPGYQENPLRRYPTLYMHDGHNLFFPEEAFAGQTWEVEKTLHLLDSMNLIDPMIVVAVYPRDRMHDYTHPGYESYGRYLVEDVKPRIDATYRTAAGPEQTAVMGSSLGGVVSLYMGWQWPDVFGKVGCLSSTFTWKDDLMRRIATEEKRPLKIYMDSGWPGDNFEVTRGMFDLLQRQGYEVNKELLYLAFPQASHSEQDWATRVHIPFQFFFARYVQADLESVSRGEQPAREPETVSL